MKSQESTIASASKFNNVYFLRSPTHPLTPTALSSNFSSLPRFIEPIQPDYLLLQSEIEKLLKSFHREYTIQRFSFPVTDLNKIVLWGKLDEIDVSGDRHYSGILEANKFYNPSCNWASGDRNFYYHPYVIKLWEMLPKFNKISDYMEWNAELAQQLYTKPAGKYPWVWMCEDYELLIDLITLLSPPKQFRNTYLLSMIPYD